METYKCNVELLSKYLKGRFLSSFIFDNFFTLNFHADYNKQNSLPSDIELTIMSNWWFDVKEDWERKVLTYGKGVEPSEPVLAYELALLRWSSDPEIVDVKIDKDVIKIKFKNQKILNISLSFDDENDEYIYILNDIKNNTIIMCCPVPEEL